MFAVPLPFRSISISVFMPRQAVNMKTASAASFVKWFFIFYLFPFTFE
jgi:hypothetical protein